MSIHSEEIGKNPLVGVPVGIVFKSAIFYRGKLRAGTLETEMKISKMDDRGITLQDGTWVPLSNVASISPPEKPAAPEKMRVRLYATDHLKNPM